MLTSGASAGGKQTVITPTCPWTLSLSDNPQQRKSAHYKGAESSHFFLLNDSLWKNIISMLNNIDNVPVTRLT